MLHGSGAKQYITVLRMFFLPRLLLLPHLQEQWLPQILPLGTISRLILQGNTEIPLMLFKAGEDSLGPAAVMELQIS